MEQARPSDNLDAHVQLKNCQKCQKNCCLPGNFVAELPHQPVGSHGSGYEVPRNMRIDAREALLRKPADLPRFLAFCQFWQSKSATNQRKLYKAAEASRAKHPFLSFQ